MTLLKEPPRLEDFAAQPVPRYTSYPTAPHFAAGLPAERHADWLRKAGAAGGAASIYLHVPFCRSMCHYCGCNTRVSRRDDPIRDYARVLRDEIELVSSLTGRMRVEHLHWGGGTPNLLPADSFEMLAAALEENFDLAPGMEHAIELDPRHVDGENSRLLAQLGVNRASLGVQDLHPAVQVAIGRIQPYEKVRAAADFLRDAGIAALNFDVMYGLPHQSTGTIRRTAEQVAALAPDRIALFGYAHVPWMKKHQRLIDERVLPDASERMELARAARRVFVEAGYVEVGIDHFALPGDAMVKALGKGTLRRNFQGYTTDAAETLVGLGVSSIGRTPFGFVQNASDEGAWRRAVAEGRLATARGKAFEHEDMVRAAAIEKLLCFFAVDLDAVARAHGYPGSIFDAEIERLDEFARAGWLRVDGRKVTMVAHRWELARLVASRFDTYLGQAGRHSAAV
ncbi:MAG: oxygen-independent coproporphyrinogen III oxidase [Rhizobiaceae bacterium]